MEAALHFCNHDAQFVKKKKKKRDAAQQLQRAVFNVLVKHNLHI